MNTHKYAGDCTLDESVKEGDVSNMQEVFNCMQTWADHNKMTLNSKKTKDMMKKTKDIMSAKLLELQSTSIYRGRVILKIFAGK